MKKQLLFFVVMWFGFAGSCCACSGSSKDDADEDSGEEIEWDIDWDTEENGESDKDTATGKPQTEDTGKAMDTVSTAEFDTASVDLTLGGMNQDLPAPEKNCMESDNGAACLSISGVVNGEPVNDFCMSGNYGSDAVAGTTIARWTWCDKKFGTPWRLVFELPPYDAVPMVISFSSGGSPREQTAFTWNELTVTEQSANFEDTKIAGWVFRKDNSERDIVTGTFAMTWNEATDGGTPMEVRLRGTFKAYWNQD